MLIKDNTDKVIKELENKLLSSLDKVGKVVSSSARRLAPVKSGNLKNSINYRVDSSELSVTIGTNVVYAAMVEFGGVQRPRNAKALAIPISKEAKNAQIGEGQSIRDIFPNLVMKKSERGGNVVGVLVEERKGKTGRQLKDKVMFVLIKSLNIKAQPFLRPALFGNRNVIMKLLNGK